MRTRLKCLLAALARGMEDGKEGKERRIGKTRVKKEMRRGVSERTRDKAKKMKTRKTRTKLSKT